MGVGQTFRQHDMRMAGVRLGEKAGQDSIEGRKEEEEGDRRAV